METVLDETGNLWLIQPRKGGQVTLLWCRQPFMSDFAVRFLAVCSSGDSCQHPCQTHRGRPLSICLADCASISDSRHQTCVRLHGETHFRSIDGAAVSSHVQVRDFLSPMSPDSEGQRQLGKMQRCETRVRNQSECRYDLSLSFILPLCAANTARCTRTADYAIWSQCWTDMPPHPRLFKWKVHTLPQHTSRWATRSPRYFRNRSE